MSFQGKMFPLPMEYVLIIIIFVDAAISTDHYSSKNVLGDVDYKFQSIGKRDVENKQTINKTEGLDKHSKTEDILKDQRDKKKSNDESKENNKQRNDQKNCSIDDESEDMSKCKGSPVADFVTDSSTINNTATVELNDEQTTQWPPKIFPQDDSVKSIDTINDAFKARLLNESTYTTSNLETLSINTTESSMGFVKTSLVQHQGILESKSMSRTSDETSQHKKMSSTVMTLIVTISFAISVVIVYVGMIIWRRYLEYRYGHRELLVNELEFDTNDLRHFEL